MRVLLIDNYDSFTFNLKQLVEETALCNLDVMLYNEVNEKLIRQYDKFIISPGPGLPSDFPKLKKWIQKFYSTKDILGVCLGLEAIHEAFGGSLIHAGRVFHGVGKSTRIISAQKTIFAGVPDPFDAGLYHSWLVDESTIDHRSFNVLAISDDGVIMALRHKTQNVLGLQFHPESIMTTYGSRIVENWLRI